MLSRPILACAGLLAAVIAAAWLRAEPVILAPRREPPQLESGRFYAVDLTSPGRALDLNSDSGSQYELIVSSLGDAGQTYGMSLEAIPRTQVESLPVTVVTPLGPLPRRRELEIRAAPQFTTRSDASSVLCAGTTVNRERRFFLHVTADALEDAGGYVPIQGVLVGEGIRARIYLDRNLPDSDLAPGLIGEIMRLLDEEIIPRTCELLGEHTDVDQDGKLAVLLTPWLGKLCGGRTSLKGFVRANDFQESVAAPFGNHADVLYLNSSLEPGPALKTLLAHEYAHAVCFSRRLAAPLRPMPLPEEEDWLNEAIAHVAENLHATEKSNSASPIPDQSTQAQSIRVHSNMPQSNLDWSNLDRRIAAFLDAPQNSPLVVRDYYRAGLWRDAGCRGATYLFLRYCVDQFGESLLRELVESPACGKSNLEQATGVPFPELFRRWMIALARDDLASLRLHEKIGDCKLAGLARLEWRPESGPCEISLHGTTTTLIAVKHSGEPQVLRIVFHSDAGARLQLTVGRCSGK